MMIRIFGLFVLFVLVGCSVEDAKDKKAEEDRQSETQGAVTVDSGEGQQLRPTTLRGYIASAFDLEVDGQQYADSEDFYTQQLDRLETEALDAGYEGYEVNFKARIGLDDLKEGMTVYIAGVGERGYAGDTKVNDSGRFEMFIPADGVQSLYKIRANKRVTVILTNPKDKKDQVRWCYNFSAVETQVDVTDRLPVILNTFQTRITRYACSASQQGIQIPMRTAKPPETASEPTAEEGQESAVSTEER